MPYTVYRGEIEVFNGWGVEQVDIGTVGAPNEIIITSSSGQPLKDGSVVCVYDGALQLDGLVGGSVVAVKRFPYRSEVHYASTANTILTVGVQTPTMGRIRAYYSLSVYR